MTFNQIRTLFRIGFVGAVVIATGSPVAAYQLGGGGTSADQPKASAISGQPSSNSKNSETKGRATANASASSGRDTENMGGQMGGMGMGRQMMGGMGGGGMGGGPGNLYMETAKRRRDSIERRAASVLAAALLKDDKNPKTALLLKKLEEPVAMQFTNETPLEDVLKYIQAATSKKNTADLPIYLDPLGLQEAEKTPQSPVSIALEGVPLKTTLRLVLNQLGLAYCIHDGFMMISSPRGVREELEQACAELGIANPISAELQQELNAVSFGGMGMGGMGGGMR